MSYQGGWVVHLTNHLVKRGLGEFSCGWEVRNEIWAPICSPIDSGNGVQDLLAQHGEADAWPHLERWFSVNEVDCTITLAYEFDDAHEVYAMQLP